MRRTWMSERELKRVAMLSRVAEGEGTLVEAAGRMEVSYRQTKRIGKRYPGEGAGGWCMGVGGEDRIGRRRRGCGGEC